MSSNGTNLVADCLDDYNGVIETGFSKNVSGFLKDLCGTTLGLTNIDVSLRPGIYNSIIDGSMVSAC